MEDYLPLLEKKFPKEEIDEMAKERIEKYGDLISRDIALFLLAKENNLIEEKAIPISSAQQWMRSIMITAKVACVFPICYFEKDGKKGRSCRLLLSDKSGEITLVLWNDLVSLVEEKIWTGDEIEVRGGYLKDGELHVGFGGTVTVLKSSPPTPIGKLKPGTHNVAGKIAEVFLDYFYMKNGKEEIMSSFLLSDGDDEMRVAVWKEPERVKALRQGDEVKLEGVVYRNNELHANSSSRIIVAKRTEENVLRGKIEEIKQGEKGISIVMDGKRITFDDSLSLKVLGINELPPDVPLKTVFGIKAKYLLEKEMAVKVSQKRGTLLGIDVL